MGVAIPFLIKLERRIERVTESGCWIWSGHLSLKGYGIMRIMDKCYTIHRLTYEHFIGPIPHGLCLDHLCRVRCCVNPYHLEAVTQQVNSLSGEGLPASNAKKTHCVHGHPFYGENLKVGPTGIRLCRTCMKVIWQRKNERVRLEKMSREAEREACQCGDGMSHTRKHWWIIWVHGYGEFNFLGTEPQAEEMRRHKANWEQGVAKKRRGRLAEHPAKIQL